jgi:NitT/TauT family transport system permease protein
MPPLPEEAAPATRSRRAKTAVLVGFLLAIVALWELVKFVGGDPWRIATWEWRPPLDIWFATDQNLPHVWDIGLALADPWRRSAPDSLFVHLVGKALYTWREAAIGFALGAVLGIGLAIAFVHSSVLERAFVPYVVASQTIPIVALAPMVVFFVGASVEAVVIIATYLTFFPVTIAMLRGLRSPDPRAMELMRSYAASRRMVLWKLRLPASLPYLFTALKITATASIVGAIIGEGPGGVHEGLGWTIVEFNQTYITAPERLWAAIFVTALLGIAFYGLVRLVEVRVLRARAETIAG